MVSDKYLLIFRLSVSTEAILLSLLITDFHLGSASGKTNLANVTGLKSREYI